MNNRLISVMIIMVLGIGAGFVSAEDTKESPAVTAANALKLSGYAQLLYTGQDSGLDGFTLRRARFSLSGELLKNVRFKLQLDAAKSPALYDAQIDFTLHEKASLRIGQFKVPFSLESLTSGSDLDTVNRSQPVSKLAPGQDIGSSGRDIGAAAFGKIAFIEYTIGVFNGAGMNKADTNEQKDLAGRIIIRPFQFLAVGASVYDGSYSASAGAAPVVRDRAGLEMAFLYQGWSLKGEWIQAEDDQTMKRGWYLQAGCHFLPKTLQGILKVDSFDPDTAAAQDGAKVWTAGLNWFLSGKTKLQVNLEIHKNEAGKTTNTVFLTQFQAAF
jgi:phosphate-selective porin OprO and OprP